MCVALDACGQAEDGQYTAHVGATDEQGEGPGKERRGRGTGLWHAR